MARPVDAEDLIRIASEKKMTEVFPNWKELSSETRNAIGVYGQFWKTLLEDIPAIEAEPVKHGKWELHGNDDDMGSSYFCSNCGSSYDENWFYIHGEYAEWKRCPNCGARMRGE